MAVIQNISIALAVLASLAAILYGPLSLRAEVLGVFRSVDQIENIHGEGLKVIDDTLYTEDLHYHEPSGLLLGASEEKDETRWRWLPPIGRFNDSGTQDQGTIIVIDPKTKTAKRLTLSNFSGPFITHGIDIWSSATDPTTLLIYAINHLPNPAYVASNGKLLPAARSQIGTDIATHLRSIWHPLIRTPNDIYALDSNNIYVTNDHHYRTGRLRQMEDIGFDLTPWSNVIHISLSTLQTSDSSTGLTATVALPSIQNPNGLGHGKSPNEILLSRAAAGILEFAHTSPNNHPHLATNESIRIQVPSTIDNPTYFHDSYAKSTGPDASGYVLAGLAKASIFPSEQVPVVVWLVQPSDSENKGQGKVDGEEMWVVKKIFEDDGRTINTASTAVLVAIDPRENEGRKMADLFVTGPISRNVVVTRIEL